MKICEKLNMDKEELIRQGPITIVAFGDSVTHGAAADDEINFETVYWNRLRRMLHQVRNYVPINVINAGIGGTDAMGSLERMDAQVFAHSPDLVIICFGLNDINKPLEDFLHALQTMFQACKDRGIDTIFMTPNMLNTYVADDVAPSLRHYAEKTARIQTDGTMDRYMSAACQLARDLGVTVCDCYGKWKELSKTQDTTLLLANRINHPLKEMHTLFAKELFLAIFPHLPQIAENGNTMWQE